MPPTDHFTERTVALVILDHPCTGTELRAELDDIDPDAVAAALSSLEAHGVVTVEVERLSPSPCARRLDELGLICL
jgi:DNA-binding HxlR family transcriptional regulator